MTKRRLTPEELAEHKERANRKRQIRHLWKGELTDGEIAEEMGLSLGELLQFAEQLGLPARKESCVFLPTPEQIRLATAAIRAGWTRAELEARRMPWHGMLE
jgi:hypothetical protein